MHQENIDEKYVREFLEGKGYQVIRIDDGNDTSQKKPDYKAVKGKDEFIVEVKTKEHFNDGRANERIQNEIEHTLQKSTIPIAIFVSYYFCQRPEACDYKRLLAEYKRHFSNIENRRPGHRVGFLKGRVEIEVMDFQIREARTTPCHIGRKRGGEPVYFKGWFHEIIGRTREQVKKYPGLPTVIAIVHRNGPPLDDGALKELFGKFDILWPPSGSTKRHLELAIDPAGAELRGERHKWLGGVIVFHPRVSPEMPPTLMRLPDAENPLPEQILSSKEIRNMIPIRGEGEIRFEIKEETNHVR